MMKTSLKASLIALAIASIPLGSQAAGLGQINVFSGLGQPLRAEIQVTATPQELQSLLARIGSPDAFRQANISYSAAVAAIKISVDTRAARPVIRLSSDRPINDPFLDLLVELNWANGRIAREYTFLLDPVDLVPQRALATAINAPALGPATRQSPAPARPAPSARTVPDAYTVGRGDTLNRIAAAHAMPGVTLDQMLVALYRANRNAFDGENINRLRAGEVLAIPDADVARSIDAAQARREIRAQSLDFDAYRRGLAAASTRRAAAPEVAVEQQSAGRIVPRVEEPRPSADAGDKLTVSRSQPDGGASDADADGRLQALEEELAVRERALEEASGRLAQLEASMRDMQKLLELRSETLAQLQQGAAVALTPVPASDPLPAEAAAPHKPVSEAPAVQAPIAEKPVGASQASDATAAALAAPDLGTTPTMEAAVVPEAEKTAESPAVKRPRRPPPVPEPEPEPSMMESLTSDPAVVAGGAGILALLLAYLGIKAAQRRKQSLAIGSGARGELAPGGQGVFVATGGQSVDTGASSIMQTDFSQSGFAPIDSDEGVDPVAEADVYMAYGRDVQAEEILQDALKADPERAAIYLKLLEIYAERQDARQFETIASELFARTNGQGSDWHKAAVLGRTLDADNLLYAESGGGDDVGAPRTEVPADALFVAGTVMAAASAQARRSDGLTPPSTQHEPKLEHQAEEPASLASLDFTSSAPIEPSQSQMRDTWTVPGDLRQFASDKDGDDDSELPDVDMALAALEAEPVADLETGSSFDVNVLDFDLDLGDEEPMSPSSAESSSSFVAQAPVAQPAEDAELSFDFEIDEPGAPASAEGFDSEADADQRRDAKTDPAVTAALDSSAVTLIGADGNMAASLEFELPDLDLQAPPAKGMDLSQTIVHTDASTNENGSDDAQGVGGAEVGALVDLENTSFDSSLLDFDFDIDMPMESSPAGAGAAGLDLTSIDLDLDGFGDSAEEVGEAEPETPKMTPDEQSEIGLESSEPAFEASSDEVDTKLELACAYDDMGDKEGALELLEEALREGSEAQQARAREMIARLS